MDSDDIIQHRDTRVSLIEVEATWNRVIRVYWSYFWRQLIILLLGTIGIDVFLALMFYAVDTPKHTVLQVIMPINLVLGTCLPIIPMKLILGKNFGTFRLVLVSTEADAQKADSTGVSAADS